MSGRPVGNAGITLTYNAIDYGVRGDGVTDDGGAINAALSIINAAGGGTLVLPPGASIGVKTKIQMPSSTTIDGNWSTLQALSGLNDDVITNSDQTNGNTGLAIRNVIVDGARTSQTAGNGINLVKCNDVVLESVTAQNAFVDGIVLNACARTRLGDVNVNTNGRHGVHCITATYPNGRVIAYNNGQQMLSAPGACTAAVSAVAGNVDVGSHVYAVTFVTALGETTPGTASNSVTTSLNNQQVALTAIPTGPTGTTSRKIYRTKANAPATAYLLTTLNDNTTATYTDNATDASLGATTPTLNTTGGAGIGLDTTSTDAQIDTTGTDSQATKTQVYGVWEIAASSCNRNLFTGSANASPGGNASLVGASSQFLAGGKIVDTTTAQSVQQKTLANMSWSVATPSTNTTIASTDGTVFARVDATGGAVTITLPASAGGGRVIAIKKQDAGANAVTIAAAGSDTIEGAATKSLAAQYKSFTLIDGAVGVWYILAST